MTTAANADDDASARQFDGGEACLLDDDDAHCGHIFFSEATRLLKFYCSFCRETYDNINYFCEHLGEHINGKVEIVEKLALTLEGEERSEPMGAQAPPQLVVCEMKDEEVVQAEEFESILGDDFENFHGDEMIVEELDEEAEIAAEVKKETAAEVEAKIRQTAERLDSAGASFVDQEQDFSCSSKNAEEFLGFAEEPAERCNEEPAVKKLPSYAELAPTTDVVAALRPLKKKKRVTTVKVIAVKNRIAELYQRIKLEEERRLNGELDDDPDVVISDEQKQSLPERPTTTSTTTCETNAVHAPVSSKELVTSKIIGETVITLLPEGAAAAGSCSTVLSSVPPAPTTSAAAALPPAVRGIEKDSCTCPACGKRFRSSFSLTIHKRTHYLESDCSIKLAHKCFDCDRLFNRISELKDHVEAVHYPQGFVCPVCQRRLTSLTLLETHMRKVHLARPFNCKLCSKNFETRDAFEAHANAHIAWDPLAAADLMPIRCSICGRKYATDAALQHHMRNHKAQEPQCCVVCGKMTLRITQHMKIHTPRPKRILSCSVCGKVFNFSSGLSQHIKVMHKFPRTPRPPPKSDPTAPKRKRKPRPPRSRKKPTNTNTNPKEEVSSEEAVLKQKQHQQLQLHDVNEKEEEAKRVIVEFIQSVTYNSVADVVSGAALLPADMHYAHLLENAPPIAREETITAVNSIVDHC